MSENFQELSFDEEVRIRAELIGVVRRFSPEQIKSLDKQEQILNAFQNGLDLIARTILEAVEERGVPPIYIYEDYLWDLDDFARSALTRPLPPQEFEFEEGEVIPPEVIIADSTNWWEILSQEQKQALSEIIEIDLTKADVYTPPRDEVSTPQVIASSNNLIEVPAQGDMPETRFVPLLVWIPHNGETGHIGLTALPENL